MSIAEEVTQAASVLACHGLVDAFGHVSARRGDECLLTPPRPLSTVQSAEDLVALPLDAIELPTGIPQEAWIHLAIYRLRPDVKAICRAQPINVAAAAAAGLPIVALHGHGAFHGEEVPVFDDAILARTAQRAGDLAESLGDAPALVMRGNGAVTVGADAGRAAALMYVLERSAHLNLVAAKVGGPPRRLTPDELDYWRGVAPELLGRLWEHLAAGNCASAPE